MVNPQERRFGSVERKVRGLAGAGGETQNAQGSFVTGAGADGSQTVLVSAACSLL